MYGFVLWLPSILKNGSTFGMVETGWLSAVLYLAATIAMLLASWASDKLQARKAFVRPFLLVGAIVFSGSYLLGSTNFGASYALLVVAGAAMYAPYGPFFAIVPELLPKATLKQPVVFIDSGANSGRFIVSEALRLDFRSTRVLRLGLRPAFPHYGRTCAINRLRER